MLPSKTILNFLGLCLLLAACNGVELSVDQLIGDGQEVSQIGILQTVDIWIDAPLDGSIIPLAPYKIIMSSSVYNLPSAPATKFTVLINGVEVAEIDQLKQSGGGASKYVWGEYLWNPPAPGKFFIRVIGQVEGELGSLDEVEVTVQNVSLEKIEAGEPPELQATPTPTVGPDVLKVFTIQTANCRYFCSSSQSEVADTLFEGFEYVPIGQDPAGFWMQFRGPVTNQRCWVVTSLLDFQLNGESTSLEGLPEGMVPFSSCPPIPNTETPTLEPIAPADTAIPPRDTPVPAAQPECNDGIDNDGDGDIDMSDGRCTSPSDDSESS